MRRDATEAFVEIVERLGGGDWFRSDERCGFVFRLGVDGVRQVVECVEKLEVFAEDCFAGELTSTKGKPREAAAFPFVNPLTVPIAAKGVLQGDALAIRFVDLNPVRTWGVATISPDFGLLSGTRLSPDI